MADDPKGNSETIGGVNILIRGDYSDLGADFDAAVALAVSKGASLNDAIIASLPTPNVAPITEAYAAVGDAATVASEQLKLFDEAVQVNYADATGQLNLFATELEPIGPAAQQAADGMKKAAEEIHQAGEEAKNAEEHFANIREQFLLLGESLAFTEAMREFGVEALTTFGNIQKAEIALTALTGDAAQAKESIEALKGLALSDALSFPSLVQAQQRMTAFGFSAEQIPAALSAIGDAAAATNKEFDTVAASFERIAVSGAIMPRSLVAVGLSLKDIADSMGVAADQVKTVFKDLDPELRMQVLIDAEQKFVGVGAEAAKGIIGQWTDLKTQIEFVFEGIGQALAPVATQFLEMMNTKILPFVQDLVRQFNELSTPVKDAVVGFTLLLAAIAPIGVALASIGLAITGLGVVGPIIAEIGTALAGVAAGAWAIAPEILAVTAAIIATVEAAKQLQSWIDQHPQVLKYETLVSASLDVAKAGLTGLLTSATGSGEANQASPGASKGPGESSTSGSGEGSGPADSAALKSLIAQQIAAKAAAAAYKDMQDQEISFHNSVVDMWNSLPATYDKYLANIEAGGKSAKSMVASIETDLNKASSLMQNMSGAPLAAMQEWVDGLKQAQVAMQQFAATDAFYQAAAKIGLVIDKFPQQVKELSDMDAGLKEFFDTMAAGAANVPDALNKIDVAALATKLVEAQKQLDDSGKKLSDTFTKFYDAYEERTRKAIGITDDFKVKFGELATITSDTQQGGLAQRGFSQDLLDAYQHALDLNHAYKDLGATVDSTGQLMSKHIKDFNLVMGDSRATLEVVELAWSKWGGDIAKLAKTDLPAAIDEYNKLIVKLQEVGAPMGEMLAIQLKEVQAEIQLKELRGTDATAEVEKLTQLQYQTKALRDASIGLGEVYAGLRKDFDSAFTSLSKGLADAIVNGKNLGDVFINVGKQIATSVLDTIIKGALLPLQDELNKTGGMFDSIAKSITGLFGKGGNGVGGAVGDIPGGAAGAFGPGGALGTLSNSGTAAGGVTQAGGAASGAADASGAAGGFGSSLGGLANIANIANAAFTAISGIVQGFQMAHLENLLGEIEVTTRKMDNVLGENGSESIFGYTKAGWQALEQIVGEVSDLHNDNVEILGKFDDLINAGGTGGGSGTGGGLSALDLSMLSDLGSSMLALTQTLSTQANSLIYGSGSGGQNATMATVNAVQSLAYSLPAAINTATQAFTAVTSQASFVAQALSAVPTPTALGGAANTTEAGTQMDWWMNTPGAAGDNSASFNSFQTTTKLQTALVDAGLNPALANTGNYKAIEQAFMDANFAPPAAGWGSYFEALGIPKSQIAPALYEAQPITGLVPGSWNHPFDPTSKASPNQSFQIPSTPVNAFGSGSSLGGSSIPISVNALSPDARGVANGIINALRQVGVKV